MNEKTLDDAEKMAREFLHRARRYRTEKGIPLSGNLPKYTGALRRASMELTRALAEMRRPG